MFPSTGSLRRAYRPAYGGACGRYAAGEGTTPCWAAAARQGGALGAGRREHARVARFRASRNSPAYCRLPVGANARLLALSCGLPCRVTAEPGGNVQTIEGTSSCECRYKARPCGPTNRAAAAAGLRGFSRVGGANGRQCCRRIRGARLDWRPRMAVTWSFKVAGLACAQAQVWLASLS